MLVEPLKQYKQIAKGDILLIDDGKELIHDTAKYVKYSEQDGEEVIFDVKKNKFFNVGMYLEGKSWAKDVMVVKHES